MSAGESSGYNHEVAKAICRVISVDSRSLNDILSSHPDFPTKKTVYNWRSLNPQFEEMYLEAKRAQSHLLIDEIIGIIDDPANIEPNILKWAQARVAARQWIASRLLQKIYGANKKDEAETTNTLIEKLLEKL